MLKYLLAAAVSLVLGLALGVWVLAPAASSVETAPAATTTYRCPMHPTVVSDQPGACPICGMNMVADQPSAAAQNPSAERRIAYWRAPMNPAYIRNQPGKSPMGMDLVPVYEDELAKEGTVQIDPVTVQNIGVKTAVVRQRSFSRTIRTVGRVDYDETRLSDVNTKIAGWVEKLHVDYTGQMVRRDQPLLEIYSPDLVAAQEEYLTALSYRERLGGNAPNSVTQAAQELLSAAGSRLEYWDITQAQVAKLRRSRQARRTMTVYAPRKGIVVDKSVVEGQYIGRGQRLFRIGDLSTVWVYADVYEYQLPWVHQGQKARVELTYLPGKTFQGQVAYIYPYLEAKTRTIKVRMQFPNPNLELKPGMYADVVLQSVVSRNALVVPVQAILHSGERTVAVVDLGDGRFQPRDIRVGAEAEGYYEVLSGLREGERIVTSAQFLIDSESNLKAAVSAMLPADGGGEAGTGGAAMGTGMGN